MTRSASRRGLACIAGIAWIAALVSGLVATACGVAVAPRSGLDDDVRQEVYDRVDRFFDEGLLWTPAASTPDGEARDLAPLIVQEIGGGGAPTFGSISGADSFAVTPGAATAYGAATTIEIGARTHRQWTWLWWYPAERQGGDPVLRGLRMTFDSDGYPAIFEALGDTTGAVPLFVSPALDEAAAAEFGAPLPGRRFAIERSLDEAPRHVVVDLVEPGPTPLGPFVYLADGTHDVVSIVCRCSSSRVSDVLATVEFDVAVGAPWPVPPAARVPEAESPGRWLRLPGDW